MIRRPPRSTLSSSSAASDVYKRQHSEQDGEWSRDARYFEYSVAADPVGSGHITRVPITRFSADLYAGGPTRVVPLDLSEALGITTGPATSPGLMASFVRICAGEEVVLGPNATSQLFFVIDGNGSSTLDGHNLTWATGDFLTLPSGGPVSHRAAVDTSLYCCLLYTSDAADEEDSVDLGGRRIIKKKKK